MPRPRRTWQVPGQELVTASSDQGAGPAVTPSAFLLVTAKTPRAVELQRKGHPPSINGGQAFYVMRPISSTGIQHVEDLFHLVADHPDLLHVPKALFCVSDSGAGSSPRHPTVNLPFTLLYWVRLVDAWLSIEFNLAVTFHFVFLCAYVYVFTYIYRRCLYICMST